MRTQIRNRFTGEIICSRNGNFRSAVLAVVREHRKFDSANLRGAIFNRLNLPYVYFRHADLTGSAWANVNLSDAHFLDAELSASSFVKTNLSNAELRGAALRHTGFNGANLNGASLVGADLSSAHLVNANLHGANLLDANLRDAHLEGANLCGAWLPSPAVVLSADWGLLSDQLTADLMLLDASGHPDPQKFKDWAKGGGCPYEYVGIQRVANFKQRRNLWGKGKKDSLYNLMVRVLQEKTKTDLVIQQ